MVGILNYFKKLNKMILNKWRGFKSLSSVLQTNNSKDCMVFILFLFIEFVTIQKKNKKNYIDEDNYVTGERNRTFVPLET